MRVAVARLVVPVAITLCVVACFSPILSNGFVDWDDDIALTTNLNFRGLSRAHLAWMFTTLHLGHYQPVAWVTYALIYVVWGLSPVGYHLVSLLLHAANGVLFYVVTLALLRKSSGRFHDDRLSASVAAAAGVLFFAIHPLRVEAVAWATQLRLLLCAFFLLLALLAYLSMVGRQEMGGYGRLGRLCLSVGLYALALLSDGLALTFPVVLLALDVYPLRRFSMPDGRWRSRRSVVAEKVPYIILSLAAARVAVVAARQQAMIPLEQHGVIARAAQVLYGLAFYVWKTLLPLHLSPLYLLRLPLDPSEPKYIASGLAVLGITAGLIGLRHRYPWALVAWLSYVALVAPVAGFVQSGPQIAADRYTYLACLPWAVLAGAGVARLALGGTARRVSWRQTALVIASTASILLMLGAYTRAYPRAWRDSLSLWSHAIEVDPNNTLAYNDRAAVRFAQGDPSGALADYTSVISVDPQSHAAYTNRGILRQAQGDVPGARADYDQALRLFPEDGRAYAQRGTVRQALGDFAGALADYDAALRRNPFDAETFRHRGTLRQAQGDLQGAIADFSALLRLRPQDAQAYKSRCNARRVSGDAAGATADCARAIQLDPRSVDAQSSRGRVRQRAADCTIPHGHPMWRVRWLRGPAVTLRPVP